MRDTALKYLEAGLCVLPAKRSEKRPTLDWKQFQKRLPTPVQVNAWFSNNYDAICIIAGAISGNVEMIDFDCNAVLFEKWSQSIPSELLKRLVIETTQSGGRHVIYRCIAPVCGSIKLAQRKLPDGKVITLIETRGEGGIFLCTPTAGYELVQGDLAKPPVITEAERDLLLQAAWELNEYQPEVVDGPRMPQDDTSRDVTFSYGEDIGQRPGDDFNARGDVREILRAHGWQLVKGGTNEYWRRPAKQVGWSATLKDRVFYVFSSNAHPFEQNRAYSPFAVFTLLEHNGDYDAAAGALGRRGYGSSIIFSQSQSDVDISGIVDRSAKGKDESADPGSIPERLLSVPGFINDVMEYTLQTAPYPNRVLAFCGALALQAFLAGRKVRDEGNVRTNIYLLALANSGVGKDHPRKINREILFRVGLTECIGDRFASGEGIQDALYLQPCMLFQTDEINGVLQSIAKAKDARHEGIVTTLLSMYSESNSVVPMRAKAGKEKPGVIDQPHLVMLGTAIPKYLYESLTEAMLANGFFARMLIVEAGKRGRGQRARLANIPPGILAIAQWWANLQPGCGDLGKVHPEPLTVTTSEEAGRELDEYRELADGCYDHCQSHNDEVGMALWSRAYEKTAKLSLIYATSENHQAPRISLAGVQWAWQFVRHQTRRMLHMAARHVATNDFDALCKQMIDVLASWEEKKGGGSWMPRWELHRRLKWPPKQYVEVTAALLDQELIQFDQGTTGAGGRPSQRWRLLP